MTEPRRKNPPRKAEVSREAIQEAAIYEHEIAQEAEEIWAEAEKGQPENGRAPVRWLDHSLYLELRPLLLRPIHAGHLLTVSAGDGKPYPSTGVRSAQVQRSRMDAVLRPWHWTETTEYTEGGKLCRTIVKVWGGDPSDPNRPLLHVGQSYGGVDRGSTLGNMYKGSRSNASKLAFAIVGPGWEVYVGAADLDPDTDEDAAKVQVATEQEGGEPQKLPADAAERLTKIIEEAGLTPKLKTRLRSFGVKELGELSVEQSLKVWEWVEKERQA